MPALTVTWMVFVLSAFYPFENKNKIISIFVYGGNQLIGKYKGNLSWIYNYSEPCIATESTKWTMCIISLIESFMLLKQMGKRWAWAKKAMVSFISPKPDDEKRILRTNFQSATKFMWTYCRRLPITWTLANANLALTQPKPNFPGFPSYIYCNFTLDNSKPG